MSQEPQFTEDQGIYIPLQRPHHRDEEYDNYGFELLIRMQREHFWYIGRHRLLLNVLKTEISRSFAVSNNLRAIDMGGGCGGWLEYLHNHAPGMFQQIALGDSALQALSLAEPVVGSFATRYQIDLLKIPWVDHWDVTFLLDVIEHIPEDTEVLRQVCKSMRPGGLLFVTTPALKFFWTYNDELAQHQRRYSRRDFEVLAEKSGLKLLRADYFLFLLSPALFINRILFRPPRSATPEQIREHLMHSHRVPSKPLNNFLARIFSMEASLINSVRFPWGTSILGVFRK